MANANVEISTITLPVSTLDESGHIITTTKSYYIKDETARSSIEALQNSVTGGIHYAGKSTTTITDGSNVTVIRLEGQNEGDSYTPKAGDLVIFGNSEFVCSPTGTQGALVWREFGSTGSLKALAFRDTAIGSFTPQGTITGSFTGTAETLLSKEYTPKGTVSVNLDNQFQGMGQYTPEGTISINDYTPTGSISKPNFVGETNTIYVNGTITNNPNDITYTPTGTVSAPEIDVENSGDTTTVDVLSQNGTLPEWSATVSNDGNLTISFDHGAMPTFSSVEVKTGDASYVASAPDFTGTGAVLSTSYTPTGTISTPEFTGTKADLTGSFSGTSKQMSVSGRITGPVASSIFTGTKENIETSYTPKGTINATFTGTQNQITVGAS